jgi:hypothetical protein
VIRRWFIAVVAALAIAGTGDVARAKLAVPQSLAREEHIKWVAEAMVRLQSVRPGMTRGEMLKVVTTEGGLHGPWRRTYVSRDCPYFKVTVTFEAFAGPDRDPNPNGLDAGDPRDVITAVSPAFLQFSIMD